MGRREKSREIIYRSSEEERWREKERVEEIRGSKIRYIGHVREKSIRVTERI